MLSLVPPILQVGLSGLAFLLAYLAFRALGREQENKVPRPLILQSLARYMWFSLSLGVLAGVDQLGDVALRAYLSRQPLVTESGNLNVDAVARQLEALRGEVSKTNGRLDGIKLRVANTSASPGFGCGNEQRAESSSLTVMYGSRDGTSCSVQNVNYYKELALDIPH